MSIHSHIEQNTVTPGVARKNTNETISRKKEQKCRTSCWTV